MIDRSPGQDRPCAGWAEIVECLEQFRPPEMTIDSEGEVTGTAWVFRGLKDSHYELEPVIEREAEAKSMQWAALEVPVSDEFKSRAHMHLSAPFIPEDELTWLAQMQHYGVPTRLLDFTYSPFVALYFAIRGGPEGSRGTNVRLWAIDARAVNRRFHTVALKALAAERRRRGKPTGHRVSFAPDDCATDRDSLTTEIRGLPALIAESLSASGTRRGELNRQGCVCAASPPTFNPRLAAQQGVFLLNCAEKLSFKESLTKMMAPCSGWYETFDLTVDAVSEIEWRLFQMNIHEQSLFPDMEGLAGFIRQKTRLQWL